ncbi:MAG: hypothetical protein ACRCUT_10290, partial [Spirochaetota bacterium]
VVGQRPMSQMKNMLAHISSETELKGKLLRPLSALLLPETDAEKEGIVDRTKLLNISGRGRHAQIELAARMGITDYAAPAGGCLFTDPFISPRIKDLYAHHPEYTLLDVHLLSVGRHFRLNDKVKIIVPRREEETLVLEKYRDEADLYLYSEFPGPSVFVRGPIDDADIPRILPIIARYGKPEKGPTRNIVILRKGSENEIRPCPAPAEESTLDAMRI